MKALGIRSKRKSVWKWEVLFRGDNMLEGTDLEWYLPAFRPSRFEKFGLASSHHIIAVSEWLDDQGVTEYHIANSSVLFLQTDDAYLCLFHFMEER